jgi:hypothetical protein
LQTDFLALYRGQTVSEARLVAVTADPELVGRFIGELAGEDREEESKDEPRSRLRLMRDGDKVG